jgi:hypothetical protein
VEQPSAKWKVDAAAWTPPAMRSYPYIRDEVYESPGNRYAAVVYSIVEVRMNFELGGFALLGESPCSPTVLLRPHEFACPPGSVQWLGGDRYVAVHTGIEERPRRLLRRARTNRGIVHCFFDVEARTFSVHPWLNSSWTRIEQTDGRWTLRETGRPRAIPSHDGEVIDPKGMEWMPWSEIDRRSELTFSACFGDVRGWQPIIL